jgi:hypothetical protein
MNGKAEHTTYRPLQLKATVYEGLLEIQETLSQSFGFKPTLTNTLEHVIRYYKHEDMMAVMTSNNMKEFQERVKKQRKHRNRG